MKLFSFISGCLKIAGFNLSCLGGFALRPWLRQKYGPALLLALMAVPQLGHGMNLQEMQQLALDNREIVKKYIINLQKSAEDITKARSGYYPSVDISYQLNSLDEPSATEHDQNSIISGAISLNLFSGFRDKYNLESTQLLGAVEAYRLDGIRQDIQLGVALSYLEVYERKARLKVAQDAYNTLQKVYLDSKGRLEVGLIGENELLKFKVDFDNATIKEKKAQANLTKSIHILSREIGVAVTLADLDFGEFLKAPEPGDLEDSEVKMLECRSEIKALQGLINAAASQVKTQYSAYYPQVNLVGSYSNYDDSYFNGSGDVNEDEFRAQMVLSMNLFNGFSREAGLNKAKLEVSGLEYDMGELVDTLKASLTNLFIDYKVSFENIDVAKENIVHAKENLRITQLKYDEGLERESDLLDAITSLSRAQSNYVAVVKTAFLDHFHIVRMVEEFGVEK